MKFIFIINLVVLGMTAHGQEPIKISKVEMKLSALGVESGDFPNIEVYIDFIHFSSKCAKSYYNPKYKSSEYHLSQLQIDSVLKFFQGIHMDTTEKKYRVNLTDQPTSYITIFTNKGVFKIDDYGLEGPQPLQDIYRIVYKF